MHAKTVRSSKATQAAAEKLAAKQNATLPKSRSWNAPAPVKQDIEEDKLAKAHEEAGIARAILTKEKCLLSKNMKELEELTKAVAISERKVLEAKLAYKEKQNLVKSLEAEEEEQD